MQYGEGSAMFCDEVRQEHNGKDIYIGVYSSGDSNAPLTPEKYTAASFTIIATTMIDPMEAPEKAKEISVYFPGEVDPAVRLEIKLPEDAYNRADESDELSRFPRAPVTTRAVMVLRNQSFKEAGFVRVIMTYGEEKFLLGRLKINFKDAPKDDGGDMLKELVGG